MKQKCEICTNSQAIISKDGIQYVCTLSGGLAFLCEIGKVDRYTPIRNATDNPTEGDGQK